MISDEEYLDDLLNSLMDEDEKEEFSPSEEGTAENSELDEGMLPEDSDFAVEDFGTEDLPIGDFNSGDLESGEFTAEDLGAGDLALEDLNSEDLESADFISGDFASGNQDNGNPGMEGLQEEGEAETGSEEELLLDDFALEDFGEEEPVPDDAEISGFLPSEEEGGDSNGEKGLVSPDEVDAMFAAAHAVASEEDTSSGTEPAEDDMLAVLDHMPEEEEESGAAETAMDAVQEETAGEGEEEESPKKKKEKKSLFGRKKKNQQKEETAEGEEGAAEDLEAEAAKPQGFFHKFLAFLTESDEDEEEEGDRANGLEPSDENKNILKELDDEDKKKKKKKVKGKKEEDGEGGKGKKKKEKKEKKEKKKKEKAESPAESELVSDVKKGKRVSIKGVAVIAGLCLTMTAVIIVLCSIIPVFFDKRAARDAFYESDYTKSYELLYGKKLDENDEMIYNKSKTILELRRKLDSYHNYLGIGKEVQALDALMSGVEDYPEILIKAEEYRVVQEVNAIYETILNILSDKYSLTEALAQTIIEYDDVTYTRRLESLVNHTPFIMPGEAEEDTAVDEDILPEERALMEQAESGDEAGMAEQDSVQEEFPDGTGENETVEEAAQERDADAQQPAEEQQPAEQEGTVGQAGSSSAGEDVSTWTGNSGFGSQGEQIQGIRQPIGIEIHGN